MIDRSSAKAVIRLVCLFVSVQLGASAHAISFRMDRFPLPPESSFDEVVAALGGESNDGQCTGTKKWTCKVLKRTIARDSNQCGLFHPDQLFLPTGALARRLRTRGPIRVVGRYGFYAFAQMHYSYLLSLNDQDQIKMSVLVGLDPTSIGQVDPTRFQTLMNSYQAASDRWSQFADQNGLDFEFKTTTDPSDDSDYRFRVVDGYRRGPAQWWTSTAWSERTLTHEMGHYFGLDEECGEGINERFPGDAPSNGGQGQDSVMRMGLKVYKTHLHLILQRGLCGGRPAPEDHNNHNRGFDGIF